MRETNELRHKPATSWHVTGRRVTEAATPVEAIRCLAEHRQVKVARATSTVRS